MQFSVRNLKRQIFGQNWRFFGEVSAKSGIWMKCSHDLFFQAVFFDLTNPAQKLRKIAQPEAE